MPLNAVQNIRPSAFTFADGPTHPTLSDIFVNCPPDRIAVPDGNNPNEEYIRNVGIFGKGADAADHKQLIKYETLRDEMKRIGFKVRLKEGYDKKGILKSTKIDKDNGIIIRSRYTNSLKKKYLKGIKGWEYKDSVSSLIIDGEKI